MSDSKDLPALNHRHLPVWTCFQEPYLVPKRYLKALEYPLSLLTRWAG